MNILKYTRPILVIVISSFFLISTVFSQIATNPNGGLYINPSQFAQARPAVEQAFTFSGAPQAYPGYQPILDNSGNSFIRIGNFRVKGNPYLFTKNVDGYIFYGGKGKAVELAYDTYAQQLDYYDSKTQKTGINKLNDVDSFYIKGDGSLVKQDLFFINARFVDPSKKFFLQKLFTGSNYNLYKLNKSALQIMSSNYIESDLREFSLNQEYFYTITGSKMMKKIKLSAKFLHEEFENTSSKIPVNDDELSADPDTVLKHFFSKLDEIK